MRKWVFLFLILISLFSTVAFCEETNDWTDAPIITKAYELSPEKIYLEWQGNASVYQVYMDGASVANVIVNNAVISAKKGTHTFIIYPIIEAKTVDTKISFGLNAGLSRNLGVGGSLDIDLAALGLDPKELTVGQPSASLYIDYISDPIYNAVPEKLTAETDFDDRVVLSFSDRYPTDEYLIVIKRGNDVNYVRFSTADEEASKLISKTNSTVTITLDQAYLQNQGCMIPELNEKYNFSVQLRRYAVDMVNGEKEKTSIHESKMSGGFDYTPIAAWKTAPVITYSSQTADGQISLRWEHESGNKNCEYAIMKINKAMGIKIGEEVLGSTTENEFVIRDLMNGGISIAIVPQVQDEKGSVSDEVWIDVKNEWVSAPVLDCEQTGEKEVELTWDGVAGVEIYHITVYEGNSESLLRFVDLDYSKHSEFDVPADTEEMSYTFSYDKAFNQEAGLKLKFEIYGIHRTANGSEQKSATSSQNIIIK